MAAFFFLHFAAKYVYHLQSSRYKSEMPCFEPKWVERELLPVQCGPAGANFIEITEETGIISL